MDSQYLVELTTIQGTTVLFGPYARELAEQMVEDFRKRIGQEDTAFSPATYGSGKPAGSWQLSGRGIAKAQLVSSSRRAAPISGRLQRPRWSRPLE
jgi:hypothetical protein